MFKYLMLLLLVGCSQPEQYRVIHEYELSTNKEFAKKRCEQLFKQFHGKYRKVKEYGVTTKVSTLQMIMQPDCAMACVTNTFRRLCSFSTDDSDEGWMDFYSEKFQDYN